MEKQDYERAVRVTQDIKETDKAAITTILKEDGSVFVSMTGNVEDIATLLDGFCSYLESLFAGKEGKK